MTAQKIFFLRHKKFCPPKEIYEMALLDINHTPDYYILCHEINDFKSLVSSLIIDLKSMIIYIYYCTCAVLEQVID